MSAQEAAAKLSELTEELDRASKALNQVQRDLEPVAGEYDAFVNAFEVGLYEKSINPDLDFKLPSAALRKQLAHRDMSPELLGRYTGLALARDRGLQRIRDLKTEIDAQRSLLSAYKTEMEATSSTGGFHR